MCGVCLRYWQRGLDSVDVPLTLSAQACRPTVMPPRSASAAPKVARQRCAAGARNSATTPMKYASLLTFFLHFVALARHQQHFLHFHQVGAQCGLFALRVEEAVVGCLLEGGALAQFVDARHQRQRPAFGIGVEALRRVQADADVARRFLRVRQFGRRLGHAGHLQRRVGQGADGAARAAGQQKGRQQ